ncbi:NADPH-hemoprotein reductase [Schizosaccharomyces cryophilus OY26]|uniref:NADPH-hemoprotein reductase n=1 Tax=Schizosaccharomyces cryophilus (strain OY26 / ATCC MYA-4695 / CBS 11777 / NBRC 106824 / NRRL Y48691) TaxID=653667 RepID=S9WZK0_SCHCR|nr:NADPH-hemoprotein reductase [Schizosaccharomyces cryophilus OY26]EPY50152.1 NADPH-hemoprotein reductase [Schizosaccharomyces cryophilus OY26]
MSSFFKSLFSKRESTKEEPERAGLEKQKKRKSKKKTKNEPGCTQEKWDELVESGENLSGVDHPFPVTKEELKKHNTKEDCWIAVRGKVYNVTTYLPYHPDGAKKILKHAAIDATGQYMKAHDYVNEEEMLKTCFVGPLAE